MDKDLSQLSNGVHALKLKDGTDTAICRGRTSYHRRAKPEADVLSDIEAALDRLDSGAFGYCISCGSAIDILRLAHDPTAAHCMSCKA